MSLTPPEPVAQVMASVRDPDEAFRTAILAGVLSEDPSAPNWAGHYMYMFHDENGTARFKHRDTRAYLSVVDASGPLP